MNALGKGTNTKSLLNFITYDPHLSSARFLNCDGGIYCTEGIGSPIAIATNQYGKGILIDSVDTGIRCSPKPLSTCDEAQSTPIIAA